MNFGGIFFLVQLVKVCVPGIRKRIFPLTIWRIQHFFRAGWRAPSEKRAIYGPGGKVQVLFYLQTGRSDGKTLWKYDLNSVKSFSGKVNLYFHSVNLIIYDVFGRMKSIYMFFEIWNIFEKEIYMQEILSPASPEFSIIRENTWNLMMSIREKVWSEFGA